MLDGRSIDTSMGFAGGSGLPMATRSGDVPLGALVLPAADQNVRCGVLGENALRTLWSSWPVRLSGDMRVLQESKDHLRSLR